MDRATQPPDWPRRGVADRAREIATGPGVLRPAFFVLRRFAPVLRVGRLVVVSRHDDVVEVLARDGDFTIAPVNAARMERWSGPFILGMDRGPDYDREAAALRRGVRAEDLPSIRRLTRQWASELIGASAGQGRIDVVAGYGRVVAARLVETYFGVPGPDRLTTMRWLRALFDVVFLDEGRRACRAARLTLAEQRPYMEALIAERRKAVETGQPVPDDVLSRLVALSATESWLDDDAVRRNINGLIVGALELTSKAVAHVVDELLRRPSDLAAARRAALAGDLETVHHYAWEMLRFRPCGPILKRSCPTDTTIGSRRQRVRAGSNVVVATLSAMFDPAAFPAPRQVSPQRAIGSYLHFGAGLHACFGRQINAVTVPEMVAELLRVPGLRRAPGRAGRLLYDGPFPDRLLVEFDADGVARPAEGER
jgi:cytochrome P450